MADVSFQQMNFLGGKWSQYAQGRADKETYRTAMNVCLNSFPVEEGSWTRRPGVFTAAPTYHGLPAVVRKFDFVQSLPYTLEFTPTRMRVFVGADLLLIQPNTVLAVSSATPAVVEVGAPLPNTWANGDQVEFDGAQIQGGHSPAGLEILFNRQFNIVVIDSTHFSIFDSVTGAPINGSSINLTNWSLTTAKVLVLETPYITEQDLQNIRVVQDENLALVLCAGYPPYQITNLGTNILGNEVLSFTQPTFLDGPYLDPPTDGSTLTPSATSGTITLTASALTSINAGAGFQSTDVGRMVRLFSEPLAWQPGTAYTAGQAVKWNNVYWYALVNSTGKQPDVSVNQWSIDPTAAAWTWGTVQTVVATNEVTITLAGADPLGFLAGGNLLYTNPIVSWQLGVYSNTTTWPSGGTYHEGRFWLFSSIANRMDATMADNGGVPEGSGLRFTPTGIDGTVADDCGISAILQATDLNTIFWMIPDHSGIVVGTQAGEWVVQASSTNDPLTPTSIQAHRMSKFGCAFVQPIATPLATLFVERYNRKVIEYLADVFSGRFIGTNLAVNAKDLTINGIVEIAYQQETTPIVWMRDTNGLLYGMTYKRENPFGTQAASFFGWHNHPLGSGRTVNSIAGGPAIGGNTDSLSLVTYDSATNIYYVELLSPIFEENSTLADAYFLDGGMVPEFAEISGENLILYGLNPYLGNDTITAWIGGIDAGDFTVAANGTLTIPLPAGYNASELLTPTWLADQEPPGGNFAFLGLDIQVTPPGQGFYSPVGAQLGYVASSNAPLHHDFSEIDCFNWDALGGDGILYHQQTSAVGDPSTNGQTLFLFNIKTRAQIGTGGYDPGAGAGGGINLAESNAICLGYDGHLYWGTGNGNTLAGRFNTTTMLNDTIWDETINPGGLDPVGYIAPIQWFGDQFICYTSLGAGNPGARVNCVQMTGVPTPEWCGDTFTVAEYPGEQPAPGNAYPFKGPEGRCFVIASGFPFPVGHSGGQGAAQLGLYVVSAVGVGAGVGSGMTKIATYAGTAFNAGWASVGYPVAWGALYDESDGNIILQVSDGGSNTALAKVNSYTGAVMWVTALPGGQGATFNPSTRIRAGSLSFVANTPGGGTYTLWEINTYTGAVSASSPTETVIGPAGAFATDDRLGIYCAWVNNIGTTQWATFGPNSGGGNIEPVVYTSPAGVGFNYVSQGQILRPIAPQESGTQNGPSLAKTRRQHMAGLLLANTQMLMIGPNFVNTTVCPLTGGDQNTPVPLTALFSGVTWDTIDDDYSYDSMLAWTTVRPYPANVLAVGEFLSGEDR